MMQVRVCKELEQTKTVRWRTERKWAHRCMWNKFRMYNFHSKTVPVDTAVVVNGVMYMTQATFDKLKELGNGQAAREPNA